MASNHGSNFPTMTNKKCFIVCLNQDLTKIHTLQLVDTSYFEFLFINSLYMFSYHLFLNDTWLFVLPEFLTVWVWHCFPRMQFHMFLSPVLPINQIYASKLDPWTLN